MSVTNKIACIIKPSIQQSKVILQRHLRTVFNERFSIANQNNNNEEKFNARFSDKLIDSELTPDAVKDMVRSNELKNHYIEKIFVSPKHRTLLTAIETIKLLEESSKQTSPPQIKVLPLLFEKMEDSCDLNYKINQKRKEFSKFTFRGKQYDVDWSSFNIDDYLTYQLKFCDQRVFENKVVSCSGHYYDIANAKLKNINDNMKETEYNNILSTLIIEAMKQLSYHNTYIESFQSIHKRLNLVQTEIKSICKSNWSNIDNKILVIGHSVLFKYWCTQKLTSSTSYEPVHDREKLKNCELIGVDFNI